jgi:hypothetical protein
MFRVLEEMIQLYESILYECDQPENIRSDGMYSPRVCISLSVSVMPHGDRHVLKVTLSDGHISKASLEVIIFFSRESS